MKPSSLVQLASRRLLLPALQPNAPWVTVIFLHSLLSNKTSWQSIFSQLGRSTQLKRARRRGTIEEYSPAQANFKLPVRSCAWDVWALDLRNHGQSPWSSPHDYAHVVGDLDAFIERQLRAGAMRSRDGRVHLVGHSMGAKASMLFTLLFPERVNSISVSEAAPVAYSHTHGQVFEAMMDVDLTAVRSKRDVRQHLVDQGLDMATAAFALLNLVEDDSGGDKGDPRFRWEPNVELLRRDEGHVHAWPLEEVAGRFGRQAEAMRYEGAAFFMGGEEGGRLANAEYRATIPEFFPAAKVVMQRGGHFVHQQHRTRFVSEVIKTINRGEGLP